MDAMVTLSSVLFKTSLPPCVLLRRIICYRSTNLYCLLLDHPADGVQVIESSFAMQGLQIPEKVLLACGVHMEGKLMEEKCPLKTLSDSQDYLGSLLAQRCL